MASARGFQNRFNAGELADEAWSDSDLQAHAHGMALGRNFVGLVAGALARRASTFDIGACLSQERKSRLIPFIRTADQAFALEFAHGQVAVWQADGTPLLNGSDQVVFSSPYGEDQLDGLRYYQDGDLLVLPHLDTAVRTKSLVRVSNTSWVFNDFDYRLGPWRTENITATVITVTGSDLAPGDVVTLEADNAVFDAGMIGGLFRFRQNAGNPDNVPSWVAETDFDETIHDKCYSNGRCYSYAAPPDGTTKFGSTQPIHEDGTVNDGHIPWTFLHDGAGVVRISTVDDGLNATAVVVNQIPFDSGESTKYWSEGAYSDYRGWPSAWPTIREDRLMLAATAADPDKFDGSRTEGFGIEAQAGYGDFKPGLGSGFVVDDDGVRRRSGEDVARIVALVGSTSLIALTTTGEYLVSGATPEDPLAPDSTKSRAIADFGASDAKPAKAHGTILYIAANEQMVRGIAMSADLSLTSEDLTVLASHIGERTFKEIVWTRSPDNLAWTRLGDGGLASFSYHAEQNVKGWNSHALGGTMPWSVESLCVLPAQGGRDVLWLTAVRTKNGEPQRRILSMASRAGLKVRVDAAKSYEGVAVGAVSGLLHIAHEDSFAMVSNDGGLTWAQYAVTVSGGGVATLPAGVTGKLIVVGLGFTSRFESLPLDLAGPGSTAMAKMNPKKMGATLTGVSCFSGVIGDDAGERTHVVRDYEETTSVVAKRATVDINFNGETEREKRLWIECSNGYDLQIHALRPLAVANA